MPITICIKHRISTELYNQKKMQKVFFLWFVFVQQYVYRHGNKKENMY